MKTLIVHHTDHDVYAHQLTDADRAQAAADFIERLMPTIAAGYRAAPDEELAHEADRLESLPQSAVIARMRNLVAVERAGRAVTAGPDGIRELAVAATAPCSSGVDGA